jgi:hypothetical protein
VSADVIQSSTFDLLPNQDCFSYLSSCLQYHSSTAVGDSVNFTLKSPFIAAKTILSFILLLPLWYHSGTVPSLSVSFIGNSMGNIVKRVLSAFLWSFFKDSKSYKSYLILRDFTIGKSVKSIEGGVGFQGAGATTLTLHAGRTSIRPNAIHRPVSLYSILTPNSVQDIRQSLGIDYCCS